MTENKTKKEEPKPKTEPAPTQPKTETPAPVQKKPSNNKTCCIIAAAVFVFLFILFMFVIPAILRRVDASMTAMMGKSKTPMTYSTTKTKATSAKKKSRATNSSAPSSDIPDCSQVTVNEPPYPNLDRSNPGIHESTENYTYTVYGNTPEEIIAQEEKCGPSYEGSISDISGLAYFNLRWDYDYAFPDPDPTSKTCAIKNLVVGLTVDIYLPIWDNVAGAPQRTIDYWETESARITNHENTHRQNDINGANEIYNALLPLVGSDCPDLENKVQQTTAPILEHLKQVNNELDARENH